MLHADCPDLPAPMIGYSDAGVTQVTNYGILDSSTYIQCPTGYYIQEEEFDQCAGTVFIHMLWAIFVLFYILYTNIILQLVYWCECLFIIKGTPNLSPAIITCGMGGKWNYVRAPTCVRK